jgi:hypothetical protein
MTSPTPASSGITQGQALAMIQNGKTIVRDTPILDQLNKGFSNATQDLTASLAGQSMGAMFDANNVSGAQLSAQAQRVMQLGQDMIATGQAKLQHDQDLTRQLAKQTHDLAASSGAAGAGAATGSVSAINGPMMAT